MNSWVREFQSYVCFVWSADETAFAIEDHLASDRWEDADSAIISLGRHTDYPAPLSCFDLRYRASRARLVRKLSSQISGCK